MIEKEFSNISVLRKKLFPLFPIHDLDRDSRILMIAKYEIIHITLTFHLHNLTFQFHFCHAF